MHINYNYYESPLCFIAVKLHDDTAILMLVVKFQNKALQHICSVLCPIKEYCK